MVNRKAVAAALSVLRKQGYLARRLETGAGPDRIVGGRAARSTITRSTFKGAVTYTNAAADVAWPRRFHSHAPGSLRLDIGPVTVNGELWGRDVNAIARDALKALKGAGLRAHWDGGPAIFLAP